MFDRPQTRATALATLATPAPRYTSYPTVPRWSNTVSAGALHRAIAPQREPIAVYVHVPFCWRHCWYCGCNMVVSRRNAAGDRYLDALAAQIDALPLAVDPLPVNRLHLGGGTPTWLDPDRLRRLIAMVDARLAPTDDAERSVEVHPGVTTARHLEVLHGAGFGRISIGVQSTDAAVLAAIGRDQEAADVHRTLQTARASGFAGVNFDLVVGLPRQTETTLAHTLDEVIAMRPDRLAVYGYAHVPWMKPHQRRIDETTIPGAEAKLALFLQAVDRLHAAGWQRLGLDHFALPDDPLAVAAREGRLSRDFMGHTDRQGPLLGLGPSAISELDGVYIQQPTHLGAWYRAIEGGDPLPVAQGHVLSEDDALRRDAIRSLMCQLSVDWVALGARHGIDAWAALEDARIKLQRWVDLGAVTVDDRALQVTEQGSMLLRNLAACFDPTLDDGSAPWRTAPREAAS